MSGKNLEEEICHSHLPPFTTLIPQYVLLDLHKKWNVLAGLLGTDEIVGYMLLIYTIAVHPGNYSSSVAVPKGVFSAFTGTDIFFLLVIHWLEHFIAQSLSTGLSSCALYHIYMHAVVT